mmetsp:Transcript_9782/g.14234  ORF Transcript_9782/g.14234 Transcript_9782/m.14234 type:complete len:121 (-) Transcript_9782:277-639(-)|eukprot:CAMPEP_0184737646 /NCGR_PEP_ID=MMETSP0315-20130426/426_1 /TAXON_ID=101924 /ORGANISM="Rhodosorus marinus, Strain UTEX LB 2760" /LENGTH=120 /DNA_ID=CAMNT_0027204945 /DNA_START=141 /DNA_END=503 /DNA_ORIENTATION=-
MVNSPGSLISNEGSANKMTRPSLLDETYARRQESKAVAVADESKVVSLMAGLFGVLSFVVGQGVLIGALMDNGHHHAYVAVDICVGVVLLCASFWTLHPVFQAFRKVSGYRIPTELQDLF